MLEQALRIATTWLSASYNRLTIELPLARAAGCNSLGAKLQPGRGMLEPAPTEAGTAAGVLELGHALVLESVLNNAGTSSKWPCWNAMHAMLEKLHDEVKMLEPADEIAGTCR